MSFNIIFNTMHLFIKCSVFLFLLVIVSAKYDDWEHCIVLDKGGKYQVCWALSNSPDLHPQIVFGVDVKTHGYVGFGISLKGGMAGSDIVTGWVKNGEIFFQDRHGVGNKVPLIDSRSDWKLLHGRENETHTSLVFQRKLETCDEEDLTIDGSTMRLIYAYSDEDPSSESDLLYQHGNRGTKSVYLLQSKRNMQQHINKSQLAQWDILVPNFPITSEFTTMYWCKVYRAPALSTKHHIVLVEPLIQEGHEGIVHHLLLYKCAGAIPAEYDPNLDKTGHKCHNSVIPNVMMRCRGLTVAWGIGGEEIVLPDNAGFPFEDDIAKYYLLITHYDNPYRKTGLMDNSGLRLYYTPNVREYDAGSLILGRTSTPELLVPPGREEYIVAGHSSSNCLDSVLPKEGIKILGLNLHSHLLGRHLKMRHFRHNTELQPYADDKSFDFKYQDYRYLSENNEFLPGDQITFECTYDSRERQNTTFGGRSQSDEMCIVYVIYYPHVEIYGSLSSPNIEAFTSYLGDNITSQHEKSGELHNSLLNFNWNSIDSEKGLLYSIQDSYCDLQDDLKISEKSTSYPKNIQGYEEESPCSIQNEASNACVSVSFNDVTQFKTLCICILFLGIFRNLRNRF